MSKIKFSLAILFASSFIGNVLAVDKAHSIFSEGASTFSYIQCYDTKSTSKTPAQQQVFKLDKVGNAHSVSLNVGAFNGATNLKITQDGFKINLTTTCSNGSRGNISPIEYTASSHTFNGNMTVNGTITCKNELNVVELNSKNIRTNDITVDMNNAADYVFEDNYDLKSLNEVESYVKANKHLPGVPSAAEMAENGMSVSEMSNLLLEKVEELTLHMIELQKENQALKAKVESLEK